MRATRVLHDDVIEAIVRDEAVHASHAPLVAFARQVCGLGDEPVPAPSSELAALLEGRTRPLLGSADAARTLVATGTDGRSGSANRRSGLVRFAGATGRVAGLGLVARIGLGTSLAAATVVGAGAAGVLPAAANDAVRGAIEVVSPVEFPKDHMASEQDDVGDRVSDDATGESDGTKGVEGREIADDAPGADHRPGSDVADEPPGQSGETGLTRANQTPAAPHAPDSVPSTVPALGGADDPGQGNGNPPATVPSTVPAPGGQAEENKSGE